MNITVDSTEEKIKNFLDSLDSYMNLKIEKEISSYQDGYGDWIMGPSLKDLNESRENLDKSLREILEMKNNVTNKKWYLQEDKKWYLQEEMRRHDGC